MTSQQRQDAEEVEWQFDAPDVRPVGRWLHHRDGGLSVSPGETRKLTDTYYDTDDWRLYRAGYALRVREKDGARPEATMKLLAGAGEDGLKRRREISETFDGSDGLNGSSGPVGWRVRCLAGPEPLRRLSEVHTRRGAYELSTDGAEVGEVALDEVTIPLEDGEEPAGFRRVEVEVEPEAASGLAPFVEEMREGCGLSPVGVSKYRAALLARGLEPPQPPELGPTEIDAAMTAGEVAFAVLRRQLAIFLSHEAGTRLGEDPEELHDMRVATRRMRAAMRLFAEALPVRARKLQEELKWVADALGEVRDLDVQLEQLETWISDAAPEDKEPLGSLRAVMEERRAKARRRMLRVLDSRRYARFVESFTGMLQRGPSRRSRVGSQPILAVAPDIIRRRYRKFRKLGDSITGESSSEDYHTLRKRGKRLRYALEFLSGVYGEPTKGLIKPLKTLQDVLGDHQDARVAQAHLRELATSKGGSRKLPPEAVFVMGGVAQRYETQASELRGQFPKAYDRVKGKRWKRLKKVMDERRPEEE